MKKPPSKENVDRARESDQESWEEAHWRQIDSGDFVRVTSGSQVESTGIIDTFTRDRSVFWIFDSRTGERRMLLPDDGLAIRLSRVW